MRFLIETAAASRRHAARCFGSGAMEAISLQGVRGVLRLQGSPVYHFLQALLTNDITPLEAPDAKPLYACLLSAQGRHLHDMIIHKMPDEEACLLLDVHADSLPDLSRLLKRYRLRQKVDIADLSGEVSVWAATEHGAAPCPSAHLAWGPDPRLPALGARGLGAWGEASASEQARFARHRMPLGVAEGDAEIPHGHAMPLEYNLDALRGVAYDKGCYVGQELVARTHYKGVIRKRLMPVRFGVGGEGGAEVAAGREIAAGGAGSGGRAAGVVRAVEGEAGLALLRLDAALAVARGAAPPLALRPEGGAGQEVLPSVPDWWPRDWTEGS
ncbi:Putative transferase CAF17, mitochondrial [Auxenochlorella protothecoides]|uniref:Putative transferase CAF17, mitochondrial n=1 Tax=Auxenochlorella protothecoides TaxID=3075 RepID=A0A087SPT3_AUXPR|nr:Putative transferase CAF17, mitochondrial [Auxenochlorella protothecoides]KFM27737.1 Putative transferase CAF17, mitochondrial [Auxenochlorella protothecoides]